MTEYTIAVILAASFLFFLDKKLKTNVIRPTWRFIQTGLVFLIAQLVFDNLFTYFGIWEFNPQHVLGIFVPFIPLENLVFGQVLLWFTLVTYTHFGGEK